jgi:uncharacterized YigZ family protein
MPAFTINQPTEGFYRESGSRFLAFAFPVTTDELIRMQLEHQRKIHYDAHHHCYAWILGTNGERFRANDDGEPNHSAGTPILGQIKSFELTNTLVIVVRYFGGTKLGVGGLIRAYKLAAEDALSKAERKEVIAYEVIYLKFKYPATGLVDRWIREFEGTVLERAQSQVCHWTVSFPASALKRVEEQLNQNQHLVTWKTSQL